MCLTIVTPNRVFFQHDSAWVWEEGDGRLVDGPSDNVARRLLLPLQNGQRIAFDVPSVLGGLPFIIHRFEPVDNRMIAPLDVAETG